jgi:hypothetical protein
MYCTECVVKKVWVRSETGEVTGSTYSVRTAVSQIIIISSLPLSLHIDHIIYSSSSLRLHPIYTFPRVLNVSFISNLPEFQPFVSSSYPREHQYSFHHHIQESIDVTFTYFHIKHIPIFPHLIKHQVLSAFICLPDFESNFCTDSRRSARSNAICEWRGVSVSNIRHSYIIHRSAATTNYDYMWLTWCLSF